MINKLMIGFSDVEQLDMHGVRLARILSLEKRFRLAKSTFLSIDRMEWLCKEPNFICLPSFEDERMFSRIFHC
jgi:hypothetical protein